MDQANENSSTEIKSNNEEDLKKKLEIEKLQIELNNLKKPFYHRSVLPAVVPALITAGITIILTFILNYFLFFKTNTSKYDEIKVGIMKDISKKLAEIDLLISEKAMYEYYMDLLKDKYFDSSKTERLSFEEYDKILEMLDKKYPKVVASNEKLIQSMSELNSQLYISELYFSDSTIRSAFERFWLINKESHVKEAYGKIRDYYLTKSNDILTDINPTQVADSLSSYFHNQHSDLIFKMQSQITEIDLND